MAAVDDTPAGTPVIGGRGDALGVRNLSKTFPGTRALSSVSLEVRRGEIHGLVGGNGSGKSTLIKVLTGIHAGDPGGEVELAGQSMSADRVTPEIARASGVRVVHQDLGVFLDLSVAENLSLGSQYETQFGARIRWGTVRKRAASLIKQFDIDAAPGDPVRSLRQSSRTLVAIARACQDVQGSDDGVLILDEPTASLPAHEVSLLLGKLRGYASWGRAILYVSHRLDEVLELTDRATVLRDGRVAGTFITQSLNESKLVELIVGPRLAEVLPTPPSVMSGEPRLTVRRLSVGPVRDLSMTVARGEIVGIAGLLGSGRSSILRGIFGVDRPSAGTVMLDGEDARFKSVTDAMRAGVAYVPENRTEDAAFFDEPVYVNIGAASTSSYYKRFRIRYRIMRHRGAELIEQFGIKASGPDALMSTLSGGNQQKVVLARWVSRQPRLLLLDEPSQGVDVGARAEIWRIVKEVTATGTSVVVVSSDFEELARVVDRAVVLRRGIVAAELTGTDLTADALTRLAYFDYEDDDDACR